MRRTLFTISLVFLMSGLCFPADIPKAELSNGLVRMTVYLPDAKSGFYRGTRFDWSGVISDLEYAGHNFFPQWFQRMDPKVNDFVYDGADIVAGPCTAITGVPEEFTPLGFDEAKPGEAFVKIGVGALRRPDASAYQRFRLYEIQDGGKWTVKTTGDSVEFTQELSTPAGYAYVYRKTVSLTKGQGQMVIGHSLRNTGTKPITGSVYDHNFLYLNRQAPGPDTVITVPFAIKTSAPPNPDLAEVRANQIFFRRTLAGEDRAQMTLQGYSADPKDYDFRIENRKLGVGLRITGDRAISRAVLWSIRAPLSIEPFIDLNIAPGAEFTWRIAYDFYRLPENRK